MLWASMMGLVTGGWLAGGGRHALSLVMALGILSLYALFYHYTGWTFWKLLASLAGITLAVLLYAVEKGWEAWAS